MQQQQNDRDQFGATKVGIRELRSAASSWIRRAERGERLIVTISGVAVAQITDMSAGAPAAGGPLSLEDLAVAGLVEQPTVAPDLISEVETRPEAGNQSTFIDPGAFGAVAADIQVDRVLAHVRGQQVRSR